MNKNRYFKVMFKWQQFLTPGSWMSLTNSFKEKSNLALLHSGSWPSGSSTWPHPCFYRTVMGRLTQRAVGERTKNHGAVLFQTVRMASLVIGIPLKDRPSRGGTTGTGSLMPTLSHSTKARSQTSWRPVIYQILRENFYLEKFYFFFKVLSLFAF